MISGSHRGISIMKCNDGKKTMFCKDSHYEDGNYNDISTNAHYIIAMFQEFLFNHQAKRIPSGN